MTAVKTRGLPRRYSPFPARRLELRLDPATCWVFSASFCGKLGPFSPFPFSYEERGTERLSRTAQDRSVREVIKGPFPWEMIDSSKKKKLFISILEGRDVERQKFPRVRHAFLGGK